MLVETLAAAALICLDPGHGTPSAIGSQREPIGPGSRVTKLKDGGGAAGEAEVVLAIARRARTLLLRRGYRVAMTRTGSTFRGGNIERAQFCNRRGAALMLRIHADGSTDSSRRGASTLTPAYRRAWTDDVYTASRRAASAIQRGVVSATGARDLGVVERSDLTGFNWADVPVVLAETGFMTNPAEGRRLRSSAYQWRVARGLVAGVAAFHPVNRRASFRMNGLPAGVGVFGRRLHGVDGSFRGLELLPVLDDGTRFLESAAELLGPRIQRLRLDPAGWPASDPAPDRRDGQGEPAGRNRETAIH